MKLTTDKVLAVFGAIGTVGAILGGFAGQYVASVVMLAAVLIGWQVWLTFEVVSLRRSRKPADQMTARPVFKHLDAPIEISASRENRQKIESSFLLWPECSIMMWVWVPPKGQGLRDSPSNRYLLAHHTGEGEQKDSYRNQFALRHSSARSRWELQTSNGKAEYGRSLAVKDGLEPGWHHFAMSWDRSARKQLMLVDGGDAGNDLLLNGFGHWPEQVADAVVVGGWVSGWHGHYCQTRICELLIFDRFLAQGDDAIRNHMRSKPRP